MLRRSFGTIHAGHVCKEYDLAQWSDPEASLKEYWEWLITAQFTLSQSGINAGAFSLERGTKTGTLHIQFYIEHDRKRPSTLASNFRLTSGYPFDRVRDAKGSWGYCSGTENGKPKEGVEALFSFGEPKLHGDASRADLKTLVNLIVEGTSPAEILRKFPYAYTVHRRRIWDLYLDIQELLDGREFKGPKDIPTEPDEVVIPDDVNFRVEID